MLRPLRIACAGLLLGVSGAAAQARLWDANLLDPSEALPTGFSRDPDTSVLLLPSGPFRAALESQAQWRGALDAESGGESSEIASGGVAQRLWVSPLPQTALALQWTGDLARNRFRDPERIDARLGEERGALGFAWVQRILDEPQGRLRFGVLVPDRDRQEFTWMLGAGKGPYDFEYAVIQREAREEVSVVNLDTAGDGETVKGEYRARSLRHRLLARAPLWGGRLSLVAAYAYARPERPPDQEFWFCDSSREVEAWLGYARAWRAWEFSGKGSFREAEAITIGRRIPPGSGGLKRFHYAYNHATDWTLGAGAARGPWHLSGDYRRLDWGSEPPPDAFDSRRETLSFNRLGLSFIANLYGGLYKVSELVDARAFLGVAEADAEWDKRFGPFAAAAGLSLYRGDFTWDARGSTLSQRFVALDTAEDFHRKLAGYVLGAAPRLRAALDFHFVSLEIEMAQTLPFIVRMEDETGAPAQPSASRAERPALRNGFLARAGLRLRF